jgi:predicted protein tyrosine phosphatase
MKFRLARHTNKLDQLVAFYVNILGLDFLGEFKDHAGYDGVFIGKHTADWHLKFTQTRDPVDNRFDEDDLLVFYPETQTDYDKLLERIATHKVNIVPAKNPYWQINGITMKDPNEHGVVISNLKIKLI